MKLCNIHIKNLIILSVSGIFEDFKSWQKVASVAGARKGEGEGKIINWFTTELAGAWLYSGIDVTDSFTWH